MYCDPKSLPNKTQRCPTVNAQLYFYKIVYMKKKVLVSFKWKHILLSAWRKQEANKMEMIKGWFLFSSVYVEYDSYYFYICTGEDIFLKIDT